jgi:hypothetical protein
MGGYATGLLSGQLGMLSDQAEGGVGSMLTLASEKSAAGDCDKITALIPGASGYMDKAKSLGTVTGPLGDLAGLNKYAGIARHIAGHGVQVCASGDRIPRRSWW